MTSSASRSCGTTLGWTNEVTSIRGMPASARSVTTSTLSSVGMKSGSIWNPSRVPTSQIVTRSGSFMVSSSLRRDQTLARRSRARSSSGRAAPLGRRRAIHWSGGRTQISRRLRRRDRWGGIGGGASPPPIWWGAVGGSGGRSPRHYSVGARHPQHVLADVREDEGVVDRRGLVEAALAELALYVVLVGQPVSALPVDARVRR